MSAKYLGGFGLVLLACGGASPSTASGGAPANGGTSAGGGAASGGASSGGAALGGNANGGVASGGTPSGGNANGGGNAAGGSAAGGSASGGVASGGTAGSGTANGGAATGGAASNGGASGGTAAGRGGGSSGGSTSAGSSSGGSGAGGTTAAGGNGSGGSSAGASSSTCWTGATVAYTPSDYVSRKWARFPIPNSTASGLPHPMSYSTASDGVLNRVTGLTWQKSTNSAGTNWASALAYCTGLGAGWSLPTRIELTTIVRHDAAGSKVDTSVFSFGASAGWTWASTPWVVNQRKNLTGAAALSWFINFALGDSNNSLSQTNTGAFSRCVKVPASSVLPAEHYSVANGEVRDNYTCLTWQQASSATTPTLTQSQASAYCSALTLNGQKWRLPSLNELASIVDDVPTGDVSPAIDHVVFPDTSPDQKYWSSSAYGAPASATTFWTLNFKDGFTQHPDASTPGLVRCVR
ncbi:MAG: DUF1566 domain-containing protein [Polyangiaceae bacterium]